jgi:hypothetical protein
VNELPPSLPSYASLWGILPRQSPSDSPRSSLPVVHVNMCIIRQPAFVWYSWGTSSSFPGNSRPPWVASMGVMSQTPTSRPFGPVQIHQVNQLHSSDGLPTTVPREKARKRGSGGGSPRKSDATSRSLSYCGMCGRPAVAGSGKRDLLTKLRIPSKDPGREVW